jgi:hypothetical protein
VHEITAEPGAAEFRGKLLALLDGGDDFRVRRAAFGHALSGMGMNAYFHSSALSLTGGTSAGQPPRRCESDAPGVGGGVDPTIVQSLWPTAVPRGD